MGLQNFTDQVGPTIQAIWLNAVDKLKFTVFADADTKALARAALTSDTPLEIVNGGTGNRTGLFVIARTSIEQAAGITPTFTNYAPYDLRRYGVVGDGVTDDTAALNAIGSAAWGSDVELIAPSDFNMKTTDTVTFASPHASVIFQGGALITYTGTFDRAAVVIGSDSQQFYKRTFRINVVTANNTYASESCVGVQIRGIFTGNDVWLPYVQGFTVNWQIRGTNASGIAYNKFHLGISFDAQYHLDLHSYVASGFVNENVFIAGDFQTSSGYIPGVNGTVYGVIFRAEPGAYTGHNNNAFYKPCAQLTQAGVIGERVPIWFNECGAYNSFHDMRCEGVKGAVVKVTSTTVSVHDNVVELGYVGPGPGSITSNLTESDGGLSYANRVYARGAPMFTEWQSGDLVQKAFTVSAGNIAIQGMFMQTSGSSTEVYSGTGKIGKDYVILNSYAAGVYVDTSLYKNFELRWNFQTTRGGRINFVAYDSTGAIITTAAAVRFTSGAQTEGAVYGYRYTQGADSTFGSFAFRVDSTVQTLKILFSPGTNAMHLRSFTLRAVCINGPTAAVASAVQDLAVWGGPVASDIILQTTIPSTALGSGYSQRGKVVYNAAAAGGGVTAGWQCTAAGWNPLAWTNTTAILLNEIRSNDAAPVKTYVCRVAGTTAGAGGPTGTGTGIVDGSVTWDYVSFPVTTIATWTAMANNP